MEKNNKNLKFIVIFLIFLILISLFLLWLNKKFTITFNDGEKVFTKIGNIKRWDNLIEPNVPKKEGHIFAGWYLDDEKFDFNEKINEDINLVAKWYKKEYSVTIKTNKGKETQTIKFEDKIDKPKTPKKEGYTFIGWYSDGQKYNFELLVRDEIVLVAKFKANTNTKYKVEHYLMDLNGNYTILKDVETKEGVTDSIVKPVTKTYEGFTSPKVEDLKIKSDGTSVLKYYYERNKYELKLVKDEGIDELIGAGTYYYDELVEIDVSLLDGYSFDKWSNNKIENKNSKTTINIIDNLILNAKTFRNTYVVKFDSNKGSKIDNQNVLYKDKIIKPENPIRTGYTFKGWFIDKDLTREFDFNSVMPHNDITLYAKWDANKYTILFDANLGTGSMNKQEFVYDTISNLNKNEFYRSGYDFIGWSEDKISSVIFEDEDNILNFLTEGNATLYAKWEAREDTPYTVKHYIEELDGTYSLRETDNLVGVTDTLVTPSVKTYEGFTSPNLEEVNINGDGSTIVEYKYTRNEYNVVLNEGYGIKIVTGADTYLYEEEVEISAVELNGYTFDKWSNGNANKTYTFKMPADNVELSASATLNKYTIEYDYKGGNVSLENPSEYTVETPTFSLVEPTKVGYTFNGWIVNNESHLGTITEGTTGNIKFVALWSANTDTPYIVKHYLMDLNGDYTILESVDNSVGVTDTLVKPSVKTYEGFTSPSLQEVNINGDGSTIVEYKYTRNEYNLTLNTSEGIQSVEGAGTYYYDANIQISAVLEDGYSFSKWVLENDEYSITNIININLKNNMSLQAIAERNTYVVKFNSNYGSEVTDQNVLYKDKITEPNEPIRNGYTFGGWYSDSELSYQYDFNTPMPNNNVTLFAKWNINSYQVKYNGNGATSGTIINSTHEYNEEKFLNKNNFERKYTISYNLNYTTNNVINNDTVIYNFKGWSTSSSGSVVYGDNQKVLNLTTQNNDIINLYAVWENDSSISLPTPTRENYIFVGWSETNDKNNLVSNTNYTVSKNTILYAIWDVIPVLEEFGFKLYNVDEIPYGQDKSNYEYKDNNVFGKGKNTFYVKLPNDKYIDAYSVFFTFNTPVNLNKDSVEVSTKNRELDIYPTKENEIYLQLQFEYNGIPIDGLNVPLNQSADKKSYTSSKTTPFLVRVNDFFRLLNKREIGIAKNSAISIESGLGNEHFITKTYLLGSYHIMFFYKDSSTTEFITLKLMNGNSEIESLTIPKGSLIPQFGEINVNGYTHNGKWYFDKEKTNEVDYNIPITKDTKIYGDFTELEYDVSWYDASKNEFKICSRAELVGLSRLSKTTTFKGKTIKLICPVEFDDSYKWSPINTFSGTFDGGYNTISNLNIVAGEVVGDDTSSGFFARLNDGAVVKNLKFKNISANLPATSKIGGLSGSATNATVTNVSLEKVSVTGQQFVGALIAKPDKNVIMRNIYLNDGFVTGTSSDVGSLVGYATGDIEIANVYSSLDVTSKSSPADTGGIIGAHDSSSKSNKQLTMYNIVYTGALSGDASWLINTLGAVYGRIGTGSLSDSIANDKYSNKDNNWFYDSNEIKYSSQSKTLKRGAKKTTKDLKSTSTYVEEFNSTGNFTQWDRSIWKIVPEEYPKLQWLDLPAETE